MRTAVTGAFGYSGRYIAWRLLDRGHEVITLTNSSSRPNPFGDRVRAFPFHFDEPQELEKTLRGTEVLVNTYWVRFDHRLFTHDAAVANTKKLFQAAKRAGVRRIVHISITKPDIESELPYFRGKAELETVLKDLGISYRILRPTVLFGREDVLVNNIAWGLRHFPMFGVFGDGNYKLQPIYVDDLAEAAAAGALGTADETLNAIGPETYTYRELVELVRKALGLKRAIISVPPMLGYWACRMLGLFVGDVVITREEIRRLMQSRLCVESPPLGATRFSEWVNNHADTLGRRYTSEMARRTDRGIAYRSN
ncbi:MAG TPA: NAD-dependent epimerase/dehydratase family protein [Verrucomicrobiae bacterium]|nr:NAD-dependent epimerase/dehydratase family protein [Verrucomicrobiae bacterium]